MTRKRPTKLLKEDIGGTEKMNFKPDFHFLIKDRISF